MANLEISNIWKLLEENRIKFKDETYRSLSCVICKSILIEPQVAPCTCRFCLKCITNYLKDNEQFCPGDSDDCKSELISKQDVAIDHLCNKKIRMLLVLCPDEACGYECELRKMFEHLRTCERFNAHCPFYDIGCNKDKITKSELSAHLDANNESHCKLMIDLINNLKNEMKQNDEKNKTEIERNKMEIDERKQEIALCRAELDIRRDEINLLKASLTQNQNEIAKIKQKQKEEFFEKQIAVKEIDPNVEIKLKEQNNYLISEMDKLNYQLRHENHKLQEQMDKCKKSTEKANIELRIAEMKLFNEGNSFVWKISKLSEYKGKNMIIWSDYFYSNEGDKMVLTFYPDGYGNIEQAHISIELCISNYQCHQGGSFNGIVTIDIINQSTTLIHKTCQQNLKITKGSSSPSFNFLSSDLPLNVVIKDDSILMKCRYQYL